MCVCVCVCVCVMGGGHLKLKVTANIGFKNSTLTFTGITVWANSADDKLMVFFLFFQQNRI